MKNDLEKFCENIIMKDEKAKMYFSLTAEELSTLDHVDPIIEKYKRIFSHYGIHIRVKDRRENEK